MIKTYHNAFKFISVLAEQAFDTKNWSANPRRSWLAGCDGIG